MTAAHALASEGVEVDLFEAAAQVGGLARSIDLWGRRVDLGSHTFASGDPRVIAAWQRLAGERRHTLPLRRGIVRGDRSLLEYPPRALPTARWLGPRRGTAGALGALRARSHRHEGPPATARDAVTRRFGATLTDELFEPYCRKLWGRSSADVDPAFASFLLATAAASGGSFVYPADGTGSVWEQMADELVEAGGRVHLRTPVVRLRRAGPDGGGAGPAAGRVVAVETPDGETVVDHVVSSLPLPLLVRALPDAPDPVVQIARGLSSRGTVLVFLRLAGAGPLGWTWLYDYDPGHLVGRVADVAGWSTDPPPDGTSVVSAECWDRVGGDTWRLDDHAITERVLRELEESGVVAGAELVASSVVRLPGTHPECPVGTSDRLAALRAFVDTVPGLRTLGRHGQHGTPGIGDCMESALDTVEELLDARRDVPGRDPEVARAG